jgi:hypothetical protein
MQRAVQWMEHALASLIAAVFATGAIYQLPRQYQPYAIAALGVLGYLVGVRTPTPGYQRMPLDPKRGSGRAQSESANNLLRGQF